MLAEAAIVAVNTAGPMRAFYERVRVRRGRQIAIVAVARKLAVLFWHLLKRREDYAHQRLSLTKRKLRRLELTAGAPKYAKTARGSGGATAPSARPSARSPRRPRRRTSGWSPTSRPELRRERWARARHRSAHEIGPQRGKAARQTQSS